MQNKDELIKDVADFKVGITDLKNIGKRNEAVNSKILTKAEIDEYLVDNKEILLDKKLEFITEVKLEIVDKQFRFVTSELGYEETNSILAEIEKEKEVEDKQSKIVTELVDYIIYNEDTNMFIIKKNESIREYKAKEFSIKRSKLDVVIPNSLNEMNNLGLLEGDYRKETTFNNIVNYTKERAEAIASGVIEELPNKPYNVIKNKTLYRGTQSENLFKGIYFVIKKYRTDSYKLSISRTDYNINIGGLSYNFELNRYEVDLKISKKEVDNKTKVRIADYE